MNVDRAELAAALTRAAASTGKTLAAVQHIHLESVDGFLQVSATDLDTGVQLTVQAKNTIKPCLVPASVAKVVSGLNSERVDLKPTKTQLVVEGNATFRLPLQNVDDWPDIDIPNENEAIPADGFADRYMAVRVASSSESARPILHAVRVGPLMAATDSYRLAASTEDGLDTADIMVPARIALKQPVDRITWDHRKVAFHTADGVQWGRQIEGTFPKIDGMMKLDPKAPTATLDAHALADACAQSMMLGSDTAGLKMTAADDAVRLELMSDRGEYETTIPAKVDGDLTPAAFNPSYLRDLLIPVDGDVVLHVVDSLKPVQIRADWWQAVIMPIRLREDS